MCRLRDVFRYLAQCADIAMAMAPATSPMNLALGSPAISNATATTLKPSPNKDRAQTARQWAGGNRFVPSHFCCRRAAAGERGLEKVALNGPRPRRTTMRQKQKAGHDLLLSGKQHLFSGAALLGRLRVC